MVATAAGGLCAGRDFCPAGMSPAEGHLAGTLPGRRLIYGCRNRRQSYRAAPLQRAPRCPPERTEAAGDDSGHEQERNCLKYLGIVIKLFGPFTSHGIPIGLILIFGCDLWT